MYRLFTLGLTHYYRTHSKNSSRLPGIVGSAQLPTFFPGTWITFSAAHLPFCIRWHEKTQTIIS